MMLTAPILSHAKHYPNKPAIRTGSQEVVYGQLAADIMTIASWLRQGSICTQLQTKADWPVSVLFIVPTMAAAIMQELEHREEVPTAHHLQKIISSGAKWQAVDKRKLGTFFPHTGLYEFYGASELSFVSVLSPQDQLSRGASVGRPFYGVEISIRNQDGQEVAPGEVGQVYVKSDMFFSGYVHDQQATQEVLQGEWATVGDVGTVDEDGYLYLVGRAKNMIISGGLNVYPEEVERVLKQLPCIEEAAVIGVPDDYWGEKVAAVVKFRTGERLEQEEIRQYVRQYLARYKCPREIIEVSTFPYTSSGKIARRKLQEMILAQKHGNNVRT
ncbi:acyl-CoA synthetase (AMP-forming)/AMP-acid ligase II [Caldalkalibacillus uzonensis]|uniref:Acyl-CoA synthetase (AMP-forming)/AMP-acid ligase II n=1 Tax=Caldalkalibacillus uzonensis TaxID=353224 RepID=A0ABU0CTU3_9BACI|nr:AMP-binding protein [Caldalkalibacillus uzonensis]MDQ0339331.1 acyl-CoA synthetase (AMP-forming)/AMP-acid ligase II [Caldalkalibacillus uzonensis]